MATTAPQFTQEQWDAAWKGAFPLFLARLEPYKLKEPVPIYKLMFQYARQVGAITEPDATKIYEAIYAQLKAHLLDRNSVGMQDQQAGRGIRMEGLVIQWTVPPPAVSKHFPKPKTSWIDEVAEREKEAEEHVKYLEARKEQENFRQRCSGKIASFQPVRNGRVLYSVIEQTTGVLQKFLDEQEAKHQADLEKFEADKTFREWRVNWMDVFAKICTHIEKAYEKAEGRTKESERL